MNKNIQNNIEVYKYVNYLKRPVDFFGGLQKFEENIKKDKIKNDYCKKENIKLIRIPYNKDIKIYLSSIFIIK